MNLIIRHTEYLLGSHDCVIVPGFGAFIANYLPAHIEGTRIWPPTKQISFNGEISLGDGLLARSIARGEGVSYESACRIISQEVDCLAHQIESDGTLTFGRLGRFVSQEGSAPAFEPAHTLTTGNRYFALLPVDLLTLVEQEEVEEQTRQADRSHFYLPISRNFFKIAASVAMLLGVLMMLLTPIDIDHAPMMASVSKTSTAVAPQERPIEIVPIKTTSQQLFISIPSAENGAVMADTTLRNEARQPQRFILVVASLASDALAHRFIEEAGDPSLRVVEQDGKHRVYAATGSTYDNVAALRNNAEISSRYPDAWVCRK